MANRARRGGAGAPGPSPDDVVKAVVEAGPGAYLLLGENGVDQEEVVGRCVDELTKPETRAFNYDDLDADDPDTSASVVGSAVRSYPMLDNVRVALVRNIQGARDGVGKELAALVGEGIDGTVLLMSGTKLDGRRGWAQAISKGSTVYRFEVPKGRAFPSWLKRRAARHGATIADDAAEMLVEYVGQDVWRAAGELEKLALYALPRTDIELEDVEAVAGLTREDTVYSLTDRIAEMNVAAALQIARRMSNADSHPAYLVGMIVRHWQALRLASDLVGNRREGELADLLGENRPFLLRKYVTQARALRRERVRTGFRLATAAESAIKNGREPDVVLDGLICQLAAPLRS